MPVDIIRGTTLGTGNQSVYFGYQEPRPTDGGLLKTLDSLSFTVTAPDGTAHTTSTVVDVSTDLVSPKLYFASFATVLGDQLGVYAVTWTFVVDGGAPITGTTKFTLRNEAYPLVDGYAQVEDLLAEGVPLAPALGGFTADRMAERLEASSRFVDDFCRRYFTPTPQELVVDGRGGRILQLQQPIIAMCKVGLMSPTFILSDPTLYNDSLRVYNRHIRQNLRAPDDREDPRVELYGLRSPLISTRGPNSRFEDLPLNITLDGVFGYTDPDGTAWGKTPTRIREVVMRLAMKNLEGLWAASDNGSAIIPGGPIIAEKTFDQAIEYANLVFSQDGQGTAYAGVITGDPQVDRVLAQYRSPAYMGSA